MTVTKQRGAFNDVRAVMDQALESEYGVSVPCENRGKAISLRQRMHTARKIDREMNSLTYPEGHQMRGQSVYDGLTMSIVDSTIVIRKLDASNLTVVPLPAPDPVVNPDPGEESS